jgi:predicted ATPase/class 3 adenylate cyclase
MESRVLESAPDVRKTVTILFTDLVDSSRLSLTLDPEALRDLLGRYFREMSAIVRRHGGTVEKYIGDAIMAVFGVPTLHEDDALRAVRAAVEMRDALAVLNRDLEAGWGIRLASRIGVNTGEVIAGDLTLGHRFVTGEVVTVAKRLEEAAATDEILIGAATYRLVRDRVAVEPSGPRVLRHGETIHALTVVDVPADAPGLPRRFEAPLVGRERQRAVLDAALARAVSESTIRMVTVLGDAGVGKSRLVREFTAGLGGNVKVARGRCLPYGEGITYWPLAEIVRDIVRETGSDADALSASTVAALLVGDERAAAIGERIAGVLGFGGTVGGTKEEIFWSVRRLFEALSRDGPLVIVVDDVHWAEPTLLELIEHLADFSRGFPILLVCIARRELLKTRPDWGRGKPNAASILLDPLGEAEGRELISHLFDHAPLPSAAAAMIADAAGGYPLFAEEFAALLVDDGLLTREPDRWVASSDLSELPVPSSIQALLAARLEGLPAEERAILTTASVEGVLFHRSAAAELVPPAVEATLEDGLQALVRRDLIRRDVADFPDDEAYRFRHVLIRDAAYDSLPKHARADLHERHAVWLERTANERLREFEEFVGFHLEQAYHWRVAVRPRDSRAASLAARASGRLESAGRRALARGDPPAGIGLLERACGLLRGTGAARTLLLAELGAAQIEGCRLEDAGRVLAEAEQLAADSNDDRATAHVRVQQQFLRLLHAEEGGTEDAARTAGLAIPVFERHDDVLGLCLARRLEAQAYWNAARAEAAAAAWERAGVHARVAGDRHLHDDSLTWIASSLWFGPTPADEGIRRCEAMREAVRESPDSEAAILRHLACLQAMVGRFDLARRHLAASNAISAELGRTLNATSAQNEAVIELLAGNPAAAEESLRAGYRALEEMGERMFLSTTAALLARSVLLQQRDAEAEELANVSARLAESDDLLSQILWRGVRARVLARRAEIREAEALAREAVTLAEATDFLNHRADALIDLSHALEAARPANEAFDAASAALRLYELKGSLVGAEIARRRLGRLGKL